MYEAILFHVPSAQTRTSNTRNLPLTVTIGGMAWKDAYDVPYRFPRSRRHVGFRIPVPLVFAIKKDGNIMGYRYGKWDQRMTGANARVLDTQEKQKGKSKGMVYTFAGEGSAEILYEGDAIEISDEVPGHEVQAWLDEWVKDLPEEKLDSFDNADPEALPLKEVIDAMPHEWEATITCKKAGTLFI